MKIPVKLILSSFALTSVLISTAEAQVLMLNFRATGGPTGGNLTNSPYNTVNPDFTDTSWNNVSNADVSSGLLYADGSAATGVAFNLGMADLAVSSTVDLSIDPGKVSDLGGKTNTGVYAGDSIGTGGIFDGATTDRLEVGLQVTGLAAGTYEVYVTGRNTSGDITGTLPYTYYAGAGTAGTNFDFSSYNSASLTFEGTGSTSAWVEAGGVDANYGKFTITLSAGEALNIVSNGDGGISAGGQPVGSANRGFLNSVQIVAIPEPQTWALILGFGVLVGAVVRRRS